MTANFSIFDDKKHSSIIENKNLSLISLDQIVNTVREKNMKYRKNIYIEMFSKYKINDLK